VNAAGHNADLAFAGRNDAGAVWTDEPRFLKSTTEATRTMSMAGMPSVMQTMSESSASAASRMASAA